MEVPLSFATLHTVLHVEVVRWLSSPLDVARLDCTSRLFHFGAPRSAVEEGLRLRAEATGRAVDAALPAGETSWTQWLMWEERRLLACAPPVAGSGINHSAFVDSGGHLLTCGEAAYGALGQGVGVEVSAWPKAAAGLGGVRISPWRQARNDGVRIRTVAVGARRTLACSDEGVAYSFGVGSGGQLGHGDTANELTPRVIDALQGVHISMVAAGYGHSLALSGAGELYSFGFSWYGALGHGNTANHFAPRLVAALQGVRVSAVAAGQDHSLALSEAGDVYSFGDGSSGQLGHGLVLVQQLMPRPIAALQGVRVGGVAAGKRHSLVVSKAGRLYSFGHGEFGALGHGDVAGQLAPRLVTALQGVRVSAVAAGSAHSLALSEGKVYSFGGGTCGELGHGDTAVQLTPRVIAGLQGVRVSSVAAGAVTSLAVTTQGVVYGWGYGVDEKGGRYINNDVVPNPVLGLELTGHQLVPLKYPGLRLLA